MDSISGTLKFHFELTTTDATNLKEPQQLLLGIIGNFAVRVGEKPLYQEAEFCLVEFAMQITKWLSEVTITNEDFVYTSLESEEVGLVWIKRSGAAWRIGSIHQEYEEYKEFSLEEISNAVEEYRARLSEELFRKLGISVNLQARTIKELVSWDHSRRR